MEPLIYNSENNQHRPIFASVNWNFKDDTRQDQVFWMTQYTKLSLEVKYGLVNKTVEEAILNLARLYKILDPERMGEVSRIIREFFTKGLKEEELKKRVVENLQLPKESLPEFLNYIKHIIILVKNAGEAQSTKNNEKLSIIPALKKYDKLGEQRITLQPIKLKMFADPVKPSVKNWLEDYFSRMATGAHSSLERSDYLFNSENGKKLSQSDRDKLAMILRSYDTGEEITINRDTMEMILGDSLNREYSNLDKISVEPLEAKVNRGQGASNDYPPRPQARFSVKEKNEQREGIPSDKPDLSKQIPKPIGNNVVDLSDFM